MDQAAALSKRKSRVRIPYTLPTFLKLPGEEMEETLLYVTGATLAFGDFAVLGAVAAYKLWKRQKRD